MNITKNLGMLCLAGYLLLTCLPALVPALAGLGLIAAILGIAAAVLILIGK